MAAVPSTRLRVLLLGLPLLVYCALPTRNFYWDGVAFAINIEQRFPLSTILYPSHLIYVLCGSWLYRLCGAAGLHPRALFLLQAANGVLAGLSVLLFYRCLRRRDVSSGFSLAAALVLAFSASWWRFAADANAYIPAIFLLLCAWVLVENPRTAVAAGLVSAAAMLFHELAIFFLPVALFSLKRRRRSQLAYAAAAVVPVIAIYWGAYRVVSESTKTAGFLAWVTGHSPDSGFSFNPFRSALFSVRGTLRLFFGGKLSDFVGDGISWVVLTALGAAAVVFCFYLWRARREFRMTRAPDEFLIWVGAYVAFLFFWMPQNTFYRLFYLPPLIGILATAVGPAGSVKRAAWALVPVLMLWNFGFEIYPQSRSEGNAPLAFALAEQGQWPSGTAILYNRFHPDLWTISYFNPQVDWIWLANGGVDKVEEVGRQHRAVWLEETAYEAVASGEGGREWLAAHAGQAMQYRDAKHQFRFYGVRGLRLGSR